MQQTFTFPSSFAQSRLWIVDQLAPASPVYNIVLRFYLRGALDIAALEQSFNDLIRRHEALRTTFLDRDGQIVQVIHPSLQAELVTVHLNARSGSELQHEVERVSLAEAKRPFDLARGPLLRTCLLHVSTQEAILIVSVHHIVFDGWSIGILNRELAVCYAARVQSRAPDLPDLTIQYADYAVWQRAYLRGDVLEEHLRYWRQQLAGVPTVLALPTDRPRPAVQTFQGASVDLTLSRELTLALKTLSQREQVTLFMTLLAAFQVLLFRYTGQADILVGTPIAGRSRPQLESMIGFFVNTLPLRTTLGVNFSFRNLLHRVREVALGAYAHQDLPFEKLVEELRPERSASHTPLVQEIGRAHV